MFKLQPIVGDVTSRALTESRALSLVFKFSTGWKMYLKTNI